MTRTSWRQHDGRVAAGVLAGVALVLCLVPLFGVLGYESAVTLAAVGAVAGGWRACGAAARARSHAARGQDQAFPGARLLRLLGEHLAMLLPPLGILALNALRVPNCNWGEGLTFYALFGVPSVAYGTTLGFLLGASTTQRRARLLFAGWILATFAYALWNVVTEPPIFAYNAIVAYFPGPLLYDRVVGIDARLVLARGVTLAEALGFALLAGWLWDGRRVAWRPRGALWRGERALLGLGVVVVLAFFAGVQASAARLGLRVDRATIEATLGGVIETPHCRIVYDTRAYDEDAAAELAREHEFHYAELRAWFGVEPPGKIGSYVYASAVQKKRLMGAAGTSFEDALHDEFHINARAYPHPVLRHEMAHMFAAQLDPWRPICPRIGLHEGIAVAADWRGESARFGLTPDEACAVMDSLGLLPDLGALMSAWGFWGQPGARAYTAAGSFVHYLVETYGFAGVRAVWSSGDFDAAFGHSLRALVDAWHAARVAPVRLRPEQWRRGVQWLRPGSVFTVPCARERARLQAEAAVAVRDGRPRQAAALYGRLVDLEPGVARWRLAQARALLRAGEVDAAVRALLEVLDDPETGDAERSTASDLLGRARWRQGDYHAAAAAFRQALAGATTRDAVRGLRVRLQAVADPELRQALVGYLADLDAGGEAGLARLAAVRAAFPGAALPAYLLGRRAYAARDFPTAVSELERALAAGGLPPDAVLAAREMRAWALLRDPQGQPRAAAQALEALAALGRGDDPGLPAPEATERLRWEDGAHRARARLESARP